MSEPHTEYRTDYTLCQLERELKGENVAYRRFVIGPEGLNEIEAGNDWRNEYGAVVIDTPAVIGDLYDTATRMARRRVVEAAVQGWGDAGPGMLLEDLLDESTLEFVRKQAAKKP